MDEEKGMTGSPKRALPPDSPVVKVHERMENISESVEETSEYAQRSYKEELAGEKPDGKDRGAGSSTPRPSSGGNLGGAFKAMLGFFTIIRTEPTDRDIRSMESNFWFVPAIGLVIGALAFFVTSIFYALGVGVMISSVLALAVVFIISKYLHFDGLVDLGDGLIATGDREKRIRALKDTAIGAGGFGVALTVILLSFASYTALGVALLILVWPMEIIVKNAMVSAAAFGEPGNGMAAEQVRCVNRQSMIMSTVLTAVSAIVVLAVSQGILVLTTGVYMYDFGFFPRYVAVVLVGVVMSVLTGYMTATLGNRTFGFTNGDVLGATNEISRAVCSLFMVMSLCILF